MRDRDSEMSGSRRWHRQRRALAGRSVATPPGDSGRRWRAARPPHPPGHAGRPARAVRLRSAVRGHLRAGARAAQAAGTGLAGVRAGGARRRAGANRRSAGAGVWGRATGDADRRGQERARPRGALQRRAGALPGLQRLLPRPRRDLPSLRQPRAGARRRRVCARRRSHAPHGAGGRLPGAEPSVRGRAGARQGL